MLAVSALTACSDEVGTEGWCNDMRDKPKQNGQQTMPSILQSTVFFKMVLAASNGVRA